MDVLSFSRILLAVMPFWRRSATTNDLQKSDDQSEAALVPQGDYLQTSSDGKRHLPQPRGPHSVGFVEVLTPGGPKEGTLCRILYPTQEQCLENSDKWPLWLEDQYINGMLRFMQVRCLKRRILNWQILVMIMAIMDSWLASLVLISLNLQYFCFTVYFSRLAELGSTWRLLWDRSDELDFSVYSSTRFCDSLSIDEWDHSYTHTRKCRP